MTRLTSLTAGLAFMGLAAFAPLAWGHAELVSPRPRTVGAQKEPGPCGGVVATGNRTQLRTGQTLKVDFIETIDHPGSYRIAFSNGADTTALFNANVLANNLPDIQGAIPAGGRPYSANITVPNTPCEACTIQLIQYMTENTPPTLYYSCADVRISVTGMAPDGGVGSDAGIVGSDAGTDVDGGAGSVDAAVVTPGNPDSGTGAAANDDGPPSFCMLNVTGTGGRGAGLIVVLGLALAAVVLRRRRR